MGSIEDHNGTDFILGTSERTSGIVGEIVGGLSALSEISSITSGSQ